MTPRIPLLFGESAGTKRVLEQCALYASHTDPVLIMGPPGTGKTELARFIHALSARPGAFVDCPLPSLPNELAHAHLVGHVRGAFTGADRDRKGLIEAAHQGTLFLDELGLATARVQVVLLQVLDRGTVRPAGGSRSIPVDVRIIAATNADLAAMCKAGRFRRDLLGRFGFLRIQLPPLRERRDEILPLMRQFLAIETERVGRAEPPAITDELRHYLLAAPWDDNIREVKAVATYVVLHAPPGDMARPEHLPPEFLATLPDLVRARAERTVAERLQAALAEAGGNKTRAAKLMGVSRRHFYRLLRKMPPV